jgi:UDP-N-acetylglucosamine 2-epimerase (non-hydrolysing)
MSQRIHLIAAARPNFMKVAPLWHALTAADDFEPVLIHTGQHYDVNMSDAIFADLRLPEPDHHLGVGSGSHAEQTGGVMIAMRRWPGPPTRLAGRGRRRQLHRRLRDGRGKLRFQWCISKRGSAAATGACRRRSTGSSPTPFRTCCGRPRPTRREPPAEGVPDERIARVGNIMLDSFELVRPAIEPPMLRASSGCPAEAMGVVTLHRPPMSTSRRSWSGWSRPAAVQKRLPLVFPVHPRTAQRLAASGFDVKLRTAGLRLIEPQPYVRFMSLVTGVRRAVTDSGGNSGRNHLSRHPVPHLA